MYMKKYLFFLIVLFTLTFNCKHTYADAKKFVTGDFEMAGYLMSGLGTQKQSQNPCTELAFDGDFTTTAGPLGSYLFGLDPGNANHFMFFVDQFELDLIKGFGKNIKFRSDIDFVRGAGMSQVVIEQAYATANIPIGNNLEILMGRFDMPFSFEPPKNPDSYVLSWSIFKRALTPSAGTGVKFYYPLSDLVGIHLMVVNSITQDSDVKLNTAPSGLATVELKWGHSERESEFEITGFFGPNTRVSNRHFTFGTNVDLTWYVTDKILIGAQGLFRQENAPTDVAGVTPIANTRYGGGLAQFTYKFSNKIDGTLRYSIADQSAIGTYSVGGTIPQWANLTGTKQLIQETWIAGRYFLRDDAIIVGEGRCDIIDPAGASNTEFVYGAALAFVYSF